MLQFNRWFWSPWKSLQVLLVLPTPNKWNTLLQHKLQMNVQLPSWTKELWHLSLSNHWLKG